MAKPDDEIFSREIAGFPVKTAIVERLLKRCNLSVLEFWVEDFGPRAKGIIKNIETTGACTESQAKELARECFNVSMKRLKLRVSAARKQGF